jgi:hypothetical protein
MKKIAEQDPRDIDKLKDEKWQLGRIECGNTASMLRFKRNWMLYNPR